MNENFRELSDDDLADVNGGINLFAFFGSLFDKKDDSNKQSESNLIDPLGNLSYKVDSTTNSFRDKVRPRQNA